MGGKDPIISSNVPLRNDGYPRSDYQKRIISDKGVAVYFKYKDNQVVLACDKWDSVEDNMWAIACTIDNMRGMERWGVSDILNRTFTGFKAITAGSGGKSCWEVLGMQPTRNASDITSVWKALAIIHHPDRGGSNEKMVELNEAYNEEIKFTK